MKLIALYRAWDVSEWPAGWFKQHASVCVCVLKETFKFSWAHAAADDDKSTLTSKCPSKLWWFILRLKLQQGCLISFGCKVGFLGVNYACGWNLSSQPSSQHINLLLSKENILGLVVQELVVVVTYFYIFQKRFQQSSNPEKTQSLVWETGLFIFSRLFKALNPFYLWLCSISAVTSRVNDEHQRKTHC